MPRVIWQRGALADLDAIIAYLERFDPGAAGRYESALRMLGDGLVTFPRRGRPGPGDVRELTGVPPYILRYRIVGEDVHILTIFHGRQNH